MNRVLVLQEIDGTKVIDVSTDKRLYDVCLAIVNERHNAGYYSPPKPPDDPGFGPTHLKKQPERLKEVGKAILAIYKTAKTTYDTQAAEYSLLLKATSESDGQAALAFLQSRSHLHSEELEIHEVFAHYESSVLSMS